MRLRLSSLILILAVPVVLAACGSGGSSNAGSTTTVSAGSGGGAPATVDVADSDLGKILVDSKGRTLYLFEKDTGSKSTCYTGCAPLWPALTVSGKATAGDGVDGSLLGTTMRDDGATQVTYAGHPLYLYAKDASAGDTKGEGVFKVWFVVGTDGNKIESGDSGGGGGYGY